VAGQIFHRAAACAVADGHPACWRNALDSTLNEKGWIAVLYEKIVGPELTRMQGALADSGEEVLQLWRGMQQYVSWFCGLLREAQDGKRIEYDGQREEWVGGDSLFQAECEVEKVFFESGWSGPVLLSGRLDQFVRSGPDRWCLVEFKVGGGHAEADAAQVCLYHELLGGVGPAALLHFGSGANEEELLFQGAAMAKARRSLVDLIGALAGVNKNGRPGDAPGPARVAANVIEGWPKKPGPKELAMGKKLEHVLQEYDAQARVAGEPLVGPTFVRFALEPERGVTVSRIERQGAQIQIRLGLGQEPVIHRVDGVITVDIERLDREYVSFDSLRPSLGSAEGFGASKVLAGVDLRGKVHLLDLAQECPHILVGGGTGGGKTEWLRAAVASLVETNTAETLRLGVVDPKKNAFPELAGSRFLWRPDALIDSAGSVVLSLLQDLIDEMERRYGLFKEAAADDLARYIRKTQRQLARVVLVVDEFYDLLLSGGKKQRDAAEEGFIRIAQKGRAAGIHLILATQRPTKQAVSGNLKANLPGKIALKVANNVDSRVLIDQMGAEKLLGKGDLLLAGLSSDPVRLQSAYLSEGERQRIFRGALVSP
jgi:hypothetical protein